MGFLLAYFFTLAVETVVLLLALRQEEKKIVVLAGVLASSVTLPFVWFFFPLFLSYWNALAVGELFAWLAEAAIYKKIFSALGWKKALAVSLLANAASLLLGMALLWPLL